MNQLGKDIVIVAAKRTPFGSFSGSLASFSATDLGVHAAKAALEAGGVDAADIDAVIFGNVIQSSKDAIYLARHVGLRAGVPESVPALTVNRLCGSGFQAVVSAAQEILTGQATAVLCGGAESMSQAPFVVWGARQGLRLGEKPMSDYLWDSLFDTYAGAPMSQTAENLAKRYEIDRAASDAFALVSQQRFADAQANGRLDAEIAPIVVKSRKGDTTVSRDEHNRPDTTLATLSKLRTAFGEGGIITAGNASGINDGAAAMVVTTAERARERGWTPLCRLVSWGISGCDPKIMGIGPVGAIRNALRMADVALGDLDLVEVNEAFAPQYLAVERELGLDRERTNVDGGAIAVGHPLAASGARITAHLAYELRRREARLGVGSACIGGGQGIAVLLETV
ncbi:MAG: acetyl-CoA C-acetyltransferase [Deltaproteobacteria bacterium]|nr:acetyl-CoA C-acetyltransferase [Deltaproteobacteria bacterium]